MDGGGRFVEIWNLVFMQFDRSAEGVLTPLAAPFDRYRHGTRAHRRGDAGQAQQLRNRSALAHHRACRAICSASTMARANASLRTLRICADHARAAAFLIHDGVMPSNEGRGYVLRKIMRRAMRNARMIGVEDPFLLQADGLCCRLHEACVSGNARERASASRAWCKEEEHRYATTFQVAERVFHDEAKARRGRSAGRRGCLQALRHLRSGAR